MSTVEPVAPANIYLMPGSLTSGCLFSPFPVLTSLAINHPNGFAVTSLTSFQPHTSESLRSWDLQTASILTVRN